MSVRILVADDHGVVRRGLRALLESRRGWKVCAEAANGREAVERAKRLKPDVAILDIGMPGLNGVEATRQIRKVSPSTEILILSAHGSEKLALEVLEAGARGYVVKEEADESLMVAVDALLRHVPYLTPRIAKLMAREKRGGTQQGAEGSPNGSRAGNSAASGRGKNQQGSCGRAGDQRENRRNTSRQYHAETQPSFDHGSGSLRDTEQDGCDQRMKQRGCVASPQGLKPLRKKENPNVGPKGPTP